MSDDQPEVSSSTACTCAGWARPCWRARCPKCREFLTKHDWTEDEARRYGTAILAMHACTRQAVS